MIFEIVCSSKALDRIKGGFCESSLKKFETQLEEIAKDPDGRVRISKGIPYPVGVQLSQFHFEMAGKLRYFTVFLLRSNSKRRLTIYDVRCYPPLNDD